MPRPTFIIGITPITTHAQACACAFLNVRFDLMSHAVQYHKARHITRFSIIEEDDAIGRLIHMESPR